MSRPSARSVRTLCRNTARSCKPEIELIAVEGVRLIALGGIVGLAAALAAAQLLKSLLFGVGVHDPATFVAVVLLLGMVALAATLIPAWAAMRVEPVVALRYE